MKIDFTTVITDFDGKVLNNEIKDEAGKVVKEGEDLDLGYFAVLALSATYEDEEITGVDKCVRGALAQDIYKNKEAEVSAKDITLMMDLIGKSFGPLVVSKCYAILDI